MSNQFKFPQWMDRIIEFYCKEISVLNMSSEKGVAR